MSKRKPKPRAGPWITPEQAALMKAARELEREVCRAELEALRRAVAEACARTVYEGEPHGRLGLGPFVLAAGLAVPLPGEDNHG